MAKNKITISLPGDLYQKVQEHKKDFNFSKICQKAIDTAIVKKELFKMKMEEEEKTPQQIIKEADLETWDGPYNAGKEIGFWYGKNAKYTDLKGLEDYVEDWVNKDQKRLGELYEYDLNLMEILENLGAIIVERDHSEEAMKRIEDENSFTFDFLTPMENGFVDGVMEFLLNEYTPPEISILLKEKRKKLKSVKDKEGKLRVDIEYYEKIKEAEKEMENNTNE